MPTSVRVERDEDLTTVRLQGDTGNRDRLQQIRMSQNSTTISASQGVNGILPESVNAALNADARDNRLLAQQGGVQVPFKNESNGFKTISGEHAQNMAQQMGVSPQAAQQLQSVSIAPDGKTIQFSFKDNANPALVAQANDAILKNAVKSGTLPADSLPQLAAQKVVQHENTQVGRNYGHTQIDVPSTSTNAGHGVGIRISVHEQTGTTNLSIVDSAGIPKGVGKLNGAEKRMLKDAAMAAGVPEDKIDKLLKGNSNQALIETNNSLADTRKALEPKILSAGTIENAVAHVKAQHGVDLHKPTGATAVHEEHADGKPGKSGKLGKLAAVGGVLIAAGQAAWAAPSGQKFNAGINAAAEAYAPGSTSQNTCTKAEAIGAAAGATIVGSLAGTGGAFGGAIYGGATGVAVGAPTGPGALITGGAGAVWGAAGTAVVAGEAGAQIGDQIGSAVAGTVCQFVTGQKNPITDAVKAQADKAKPASTRVAMTGSEQTAPRSATNHQQFQQEQAAEGLVGMA